MTPDKPRLVVIGIAMLMMAGALVLMQQQISEFLNIKKKKVPAEEAPGRKQELLDGLISHKSKETLPKMQATNSWFVEGLASFMESYPIGELNKGRLAQAQEAMREERILPIEFLNTFRMGSFPRLAGDSMGFAYAQSWVLCHFLMTHHRVGFLNFLERRASEQPEEDQELEWLVEALGVEKQALEKSFQAYLQSLPPEDPEWLRVQQHFIDLRAELVATAARLWSR